LGFTVLNALLLYAGFVFALVGWSEAVRIVEDLQLVRTGPSVVVRNPIYSGIPRGVLGTVFV